MQKIYALQKEFIEFLNQKTFQGDPSTLYEPINYLMHLGGKRIRPVLLLSAFDLFSEEVTHAYDAALAIEVFHNFTLAHDDIMDQATLRRGQPTMHHQYNTNTAILAGDLMLIHAYDLLAKNTGKSDWKTLFSVFSKAAREICEGQQMDMDFESREVVHREEYIQMIQFKTAVLLGAAMKIGALMGGASEQDAAAIYDFAVNLGIAFQINDDILDTYGDPYKVGKKKGGDIAQHKKTYLWICCREAMDESSTALFNTYLSLPPDQESDKIQGIMQLYDRYNVLQEAKEVTQTYYNIAQRSLDNMSIDQDKKEGLIHFAENLMNREY